MKKLIAMWMLVVFSIFGCVSMYQQEKELTPFEVACTELAVDCSEITPPIAVISKLVSDGLYGLYIHGEPYIFIRAGVGPKQLEQTIIHETVHYVIYEAKVLLSRCDGERTAREITAKATNTKVALWWEKQYECVSAWLYNG